MAQPEPPVLSLGFEFEFWIPLLFNDLKNKQHPLKSDGRKLFLTGTESANGEAWSGKPWVYDRDNPAHANWRPNTHRVPTKESENVMLDGIRKLLRKAVTPQGADLVSDLNIERTELGPLLNGVHDLYQRYTVYADRGLVADKQLGGYRKDSQVYVGQYYFDAVEVRTPAFTEANNGNYRNMCGQIESVLTAITQTYPVSINAGADVWYEPPDYIKTEEKALRAESRCGTHIHVGAAGVLEYLEVPKDPKNPSPKELAALNESMSKRIFAAKKIVTLYWLVEPQIQWLHASWRSEDSRYSGLLREHTNLASYLAPSERKQELHPYHKHEEANNKASNHYDKKKFDEELQGQSKSRQLSAAELKQHEGLAEMLSGVIRLKGGTQKDQDAIAIIWKTRNMDQLAWLVSNFFGNRRGSLCLHQLLPWDSDFRGGGVRKEMQRIGTVEYRFMQASLDADAVLAWADVVMKMTEGCVTGGTDDFMDFIRRVVPRHLGEPPDPKAFVKRLGLKEGSRPYKFYDKDTQRRFDEDANPRIVKNGVANILVPKPQ